MSHLSVPTPSRGPTASPQPMEGANIPAPSVSPQPAMEDVPNASSAAAASSSAAAPDAMDVTSEVVHTYARHANAPILTAEEERTAFAKLYKSVLKTGDEYAILPAKWFESWCAYSGFDQRAADLGQAMTDVDAPATVTRTTDDRPGYIDCAILLAPPPESLGDNLRTTWIELRQDIQEGADFVALNYDAVLRLCEWYGGGPLIIRKVIEVGLSQTETIELHPQHLVITPIVENVVQAAQRRVKTFPKAVLFADILNDLKPKGLSPDERAKYETRAWRRRTTPLDPNVLAEIGEDAAKVPDVVTGLTAAQQSPAEFIRHWEVMPKPEVQSKVEFLEFERGTELILETRLIGQPWARRGNGSTHDWKELRKGDLVDCCDTEHKWYQAEVLYIQPNATTQVREARVHFLNWNVKYDDTIALKPEAFAEPYVQGVTRFAEKHTYTNAPHVPNIPKKQVREDVYSYYPGGGVKNSMMKPEVRGAVGLRNLGNTCFMNSTLQCMANTPGLTEFFTSDKFVRYINRINPLGAKGKIAEAYGALLKEIWSGEFATVAPRELKQVIGERNPVFSGYQQQDSSEFLSFLLDGLHEDLNRVLKKPPTQPVDSNGRPDAIVAKESWDRHLLRNQSVVVDACQGQYKSCVVCPQCQRESITFDPFMFLSVPLPVPNTRELPVIVVQTGATTAQDKNDSIAPYIWPLRIPKDGMSVAELKAEVKEAVNHAPESSPGVTSRTVSTSSLIAAEIFQNKIFKVLAPDFPTSRIGKQDVIVFYHVPEMEQNSEESKYTTLQCVHLTTKYNRPERIGVPIVLALRSNELAELKMSTLRAAIKRAVAPWMNHGRGWQEGVDHDTKLYDIILMDRKTDIVIMNLPYTNADGAEDFVIDILKPTSEYHQRMRTGENGMSFALKWKIEGETLGEKLITGLDGLTHPPHITAARATASKKKNGLDMNSLDLSDCLDAYARVEKLRKSEAWYCSNCKAHQEATKKLDLWRVPDILIIHLKRFTYDAIRRDKIDVYVDFPLENLDLAPFMVNEADKANKANTLYDLYAISNHYGGLGGGHYTAYAKNLVNGQWYNLDDSTVTRITQPHTIKSPAAYVLFYRRKAAKFNNL